MLKFIVLIVPIVLPLSSAVLSKTPTKTQIPSTNITYIQHQIDALRQEIERNVAENNKVENLIKKKKKKKLRKGFTKVTNQK